MHHFADRSSYFRDARRYLRPGAKVAIIDYVNKHRSAPPEVIESELAAAGYRLETRNDFLEKQSFLIFRSTG